MGLLIEISLDDSAKIDAELRDSTTKSLKGSRLPNDQSCERHADSVGYANSCRWKTMRTRFGEMQLAIHQSRETEFYPQRSPVHASAKAGPDRSVIQFLWVQNELFAEKGFVSLQFFKDMSKSNLDFSSVMSASLDPCLYQLFLS